MKSRKKLISALLALVMIISCMPAVSAAEDGITVSRLEASELTSELLGTLKEFQSEDFQSENTKPYAQNEQVRAIVVMEGEPAAAQNAAERSGRMMMKAAGNGRRLFQQHADLCGQMEAESIDYTVNYDFTTLLNAMSITAAYGDLYEISQMDGVAAVYPVVCYELPKHTVQTAYADIMTGLTGVHENGYKGSSTVIAVLDTGITPDHEAFQVYDGMLQSTVLERADIESLVADGKVNSGIYLSAKIPFSYDYADEDNDATDDTNGHGTHVAGIAAGYAQEADGAVTFVGSAPDAQIIAMKVFSSGENQTTTSDIYFKALEDAYYLGADVINMSLGSPSGFTNDWSLDGEIFGNIYKILEENGVVCCVSAGNETSMALHASNWAGSGYVTSDYADYGVVGSPSTYEGNLSVASIENTNYPESNTLTVNGAVYPYYDSSDSGTIFRTAFGGKTCMVIDAGYGTVEDFEILGEAVTGNVALISRGDITFQEKVTNAADAGAIGAIIYNNDAGIISMAIDDFAVPAVSVTQKAGNAILATLTMDGIGSVVINAETQGVANETAGQISEFSSWGCTPDLKLKPQITGVGGMVNSVEYLTTDDYVVMSGTSMAAPNLTGGMASLLSYLKTEYPDIPKAERAQFAEALLLSSAAEIQDTYGFLYSPRRQGAGLMDIGAAIALTDKAYISAPICNVGENGEGVFTITFTVTDLSGEGGRYTITPHVLYDWFDYGDLDSDGVPEVFNTLTSDELEIGNTYNFTTNCTDDTVVLAANETVTVTATVTLSNEARETFDGFFPNGNFIEGFIDLNEVGQPATGAVLHATFMGFYGDWDKAPVLEKVDFRDVVDINTWLEADEQGKLYQEYGYTYIDFLDSQVNTDINTAYLANLSEGQIYGYAGDNMFAYVSPYDEARIAIPSPEADSALIDVLYMEPMNIRNARHLIMVVSDQETGEIYYVDDTEYLPKARYDEDYSYWIPTGSFMYDGTDLEGAPVANDTVVDIDYYTNIDFEDDELGAIIEEYGYEGLKIYAPDHLEWNFDCTIDSEVPELIDIDFNAESGTLTIQVKDNQFLASVDIYDGMFALLDGMGFAEDEIGQISEAELNVNGNNAVYLVLADYATNQAIYQISLEDNLITVSADPEEGGIVSGDGAYEAFSTVTVTAEPNEGYRFVGWYIDGELVSTDAEYTFKATGDTDLVARFTQLYILTIYDEGKTLEEYAEGDIVTLTQGERRGYDFVGWRVLTKNAVVEDGSFTMPAADVTIIAVWSPKMHSADEIPVPDPIKPIETVSDNGKQEEPTADDRGNAQTEKEPAGFPFVDVTTKDWYYDDAAYVFEKGLMNGTSETLFSAEISTTRSMIVSILWRLEGKPVVNYAMNFPDVADNMYYTEAVRWAAANDIVDGYDDGCFGPDDNITREQLAAILYRYAVYKGYDVSVGENTNILSYADIDELGEWAIPAMQWVCGAGLIGGDENGNLNPKGEASRGEVAAILHRFCKAYID